MYFIDDEHENNFDTLIEQYCGAVWQENVQYAANCYIAAVPAIYELLEDGEESTGGPLTKIVTYENAENGSTEMIPTHKGLTGSTTKLLEIGMSLYNGHPVDLDYSLSHEFAQVVVQAFKIRYKLA